MKVKILKSSMNSYWYSNDVNKEFNVHYNITDRSDPFRHNITTHYIRNSDCAITELPESFCVKRCEDRKKLEKYIKWLNKTYGCKYNGNYWDYHGYIQEHGFDSSDEPFGTEIHIDDMIKHIDYMESQQHIKGGEQFYKESQLTVKMKQEFDLTTDEGKLAYAKKYYPIGTKYISLGSDGQVYRNSEITSTPRYFGNCIEGGFAYIYANGKWAEIIKEEINMGTQKLSRQGLKEIHSVACSSWKETLEQFGRRNPLEDYIELTQEEVDIMFDACTKEQLPIVSKYLKKDEGTVDIMKFKCEIYDNDGRAVIEKRFDGEYGHKSLLLDDAYNWEIKKDSKGYLCLIPTKKK